MGEADTIGEANAGDDRPCRTVARVVADDASVAARLQCIDHPFMHVEADSRLAEEYPPIGRYVEIVRKAQTRVVDDGGPRAIGLVGQLHHLAGLTDDLVKSHA